MLTLIAKLLKIINSESDPGQISLAFCLAMIAGFTPLLSLHNLLILLLILILRVNLSAFILGLGVFSCFAYLLDPLFHEIGQAFLTFPALEGFFTILYGITLMRLFAYNNTLVFGSLLLALILFVPLYFVFNALIIRYRETLLAWVQQTKMMLIFKASKVYSIYQSLSGFGGSQ
ncbi:MAG: TIGR03546 family protein [Proteobacteria bacterium]|nr:TIGR03546 family protein [Pseudomonadota bacterium]MBU1708625.1 TIGR03546 family protein [Pseudomonadota bacterium]